MDVPARHFRLPSLYSTLLIGIVAVNIIKPGVDRIAPETLAQVVKQDRVTSAKAKILDALAEITDLPPEEIEGVFQDLPSVEHAAPNVSKILENLLLMLFTDNLFSAAVNTNLLPLIIFSIIFAGMLTTMGAKVDAITKIIAHPNWNYTPVHALNDSPPRPAKRFHDFTTNRDNAFAPCRLCLAAHFDQTALQIDPIACGVNRLQVFRTRFRRSA